MDRLIFENAPRSPVRSNARMDVACFVGFIHLREGASLDAGHLLTVDRWETFDRICAWDQRDGLNEPPIGTYLGAAVRSFFVQGGRKCYVVALGGRNWKTALRNNRLSWLNELLPGYQDRFDASPIDPLTWKGAARILGLPDVSFLCIPDLAAICAADAPTSGPKEPLPGTPEIFVECSTPGTMPPENTLPSLLPAPRCDAAGYREWAKFVLRVNGLLARYAREVQFVTALPLPHRDDVELLSHKDVYAFLVNDLVPQSAYVQIAYPWVATSGSKRLPGSLESPDAIIVGMLAANALARGTFRSAMGRLATDVIDINPVLPRSTMATKSGDLALIDRISLFGHTPAGIRLLSDVTTSSAEEHRQGGIHRLFAVITRAVRLAGAAVVFEPANQATRGKLVTRIEQVMTQLWEAGAFRGVRAKDAFSVRCDRTTMTQADIDAGRMVTEIEFAPTHAIERIRVVLTLTEGGNATLQSRST